jgi:hypothetical protein
MKKNLVWLCLCIAFAGGIFAGWVDFNNNEVQAAVLVILAVIFLTGMIAPGKSWLWAVIVALCLPGVYLIATQLGYKPVSPPNPVWYASLFALVPAFIGAYSGAMSRVIMNRVFKTS